MGCHESPNSTTPSPPCQTPFATDSHGGPIRGALRRVSNEQIRSATQYESRGIEILNRYFHDLKTDLERTCGARRCADVARAPWPRGSLGNCRGRSSSTPAPSAVSYTHLTLPTILLV
eukprot:1940771-Pyramimonas_sp.AAC.1